MHAHGKLTIVLCCLTFCVAFSLLHGRLAAAPVEPFEQLATAKAFDDGRLEIKLQGDFKATADNAARRLVDGRMAASGKKSGAVKVAAGSSFTAVLRWKDGAPRCVTSIRIGYTGEFTPSFAWTDADGNRRRARALAPVVLPRKPSATSYMIFESLAWNAVETAIEFRAGKDSQITEVQLVGFNRAIPEPFLCVRREMNIPPVNQAIRLDVTCFNPTKAAVSEGALIVEDISESQERRQAARLKLPAVPPGQAAPTSCDWRTPAGAGRYELLASWLAAAGKEDAGGKEEKPICRTGAVVYVTQPKLHMVWYGEPRRTGHTTALTTVGDELNAYDWQKQGAIAMSWAPGVCRTKDTEEDFIRDWSGRIESHGRGIAIDEFAMSPTSDFCVQMASALVPVKTRFPDMPIYVWWCVSIGAGVDAPVRQAADLIMMECYMEYVGHIYLHFSLMLSRARSLGLTHKAVFALACTSEKAGTSAEQLTDQFRYIRELAPELPGVAVYKAYGAGAALAPLTDELFERYFLAPVLRVVVKGELPGAVVVQNIGQTTATDVELELTGLPEGTTAEKKRIERLVPGRSQTVRWKLPKELLPTARVRIVESPRYTVVSLPKPLR